MYPNYHKKNFALNSKMNLTDSKKSMDLKVLKIRGLNISLDHGFAQDLELFADFKNRGPNKPSHGNLSGEFGALSVL